MSLLCSIYHYFPVKLCILGRCDLWSISDHNSDQQSRDLGARDEIMWAWFGRFTVWVMTTPSSLVWCWNFFSMQCHNGVVPSKPGHVSLYHSTTRGGS